MDIRSLVKGTVKKYGTRNPFAIAKASGAMVIYAPLIGIRGFYQYYKRNHLIYINDGLCCHEQEFVCAHELGHMFLHKNTNTVYMDTHTLFNTNKYETEANIFAAELLIADELILENNGYTVEQLARLLSYEERLIALRLDNYREL